jgi:hypothetical protein
LHAGSSRSGRWQPLICVAGIKCHLPVLHLFKWGDAQRSSFIRHQERNDIVRSRSEILSKDLRRWLQDTQVFVSAATARLPKRSPPFMKTNLRIGLPSHVTE